MGEREAARIADRLDLPGDPRRAFGFDVVVPQRPHGLDETPRWINLDVLALTQERRVLRVDHLPRRAHGPVRLLVGAELVLRPDVRARDCLPETLRRGLDIDLEHLLHLALHSLFEVAETSGPRFGVFADPAVVHEADRDDIEEMELLATSPLGDDQAGR